MSEKTPAVRQVSWGAIVVHVGVIVVAMLAAATVFGEKNVVPATIVIAATFVVYMFVSQWALARRHRAGTQRLREGRFEDAIAHFESSYAFFARRAWLDKYRCLTMLSISAASYREMALVSIAFCHSRLGDAEKMKQYYVRALTEFPHSAVAKACLAMIAALEKRQPPAQRTDEAG
jgi:tetratricopeptide (TPR) repeat protein